MKTALCVSIGVMLLLDACGISQLEYERTLLEEAQLCRPGDTCVLAGRGECECDQPVNASYAKRLAKAARSVRCEAYPKCISYGAPRCEGGRCVADRD
jgi:hypothetical protein